MAVAAWPLAQFSCWQTWHRVRENGYGMMAVLPQRILEIREADRHKTQTLEV